MPSGRNVCNSWIQKLFFLSLIFFPTWIVVNDINFGSAKVLEPMSAPATQSVDSRARESFS